MSRKSYTVYILGNKRRSVLYTGITSDLLGRVWQHKEKLFGGFTAKYNVDQLIYFEDWENSTDAIAREKEIKGWSRQKKEALIKEMNPQWRDLYVEIQ